ncbi:MAG: DUF3795 domain-containing protein [candidate division Zixibacteria bacterium]|nr:DUF3795 domain-containing protein [candidate division Zixibacteria bacterium]
MPDLKYATYCGLYCGLCSSRGRIPKQAKALYETLKNEGFEYWGEFIDPKAKEFMSVLEKLNNSDNICPGCRQGGGPPFCGIRKCAKEKNIEVCAFCDEFPCKKIDGLAKGYVNLIADGKRLKEIGLDDWIDEQKERAKTGFCYVDIRCSPYEIPE